MVVWFFHTASGSTNADEVADVQVSELDEMASPYILDEPPAVLSIGARCMHLGYSFIWPARNAHTLCGRMVFGSICVLQGMSPTLFQEPIGVNR